MHRLIFSLATLTLFLCLPLLADPPEPTVIWGIKKPNDPRSRLVGGIKKDGVDLSRTQGQGANGTGTSGNSGGAGLSGSGNGSSSGANRSDGLNVDGTKSGGDGTLTVDDGASKNTGNQNGSPKSKQGGSSTPGGDIRIFEKWWPVCAFLDPNITQETGNTAMKELVDKAARCEVNVVVFPVTIKANYGIEPEPVNAKSVEKCNLAETGIATAGSATALVEPDEMAAKMCKAQIMDPKTGKMIWNKEVAGCAQMRSTTDMEDPEMKKALEAGEAKENLAKSSTGVAPSIEVPNGHKGWVVSHEALGHSQMGQPNGSSYGMGIGPAQDKGEEVEGEEWTDAGCDIMRKQALTNDKKFGWNPNQTTYYTKQTNPEYQYDLMNGEPLFKKPSGPPPGIPPRTPQLANGGPTRLGYDDNAPGKAPTPDKGPAPITPAVTNLDEKHKQKPPDALLAAARKSKKKADAPDPNDTFAPPETAKVENSSRLGMDDSAKKSQVSVSGGEISYSSGDSGSSSASSEETPSYADMSFASPAAKKPTTLGMDDSAAKNLSGATGGAATGEKGSSLSMDDNAAKSGVEGSAGGDNRSPASVSGSGGGSLSSSKVGLSDEFFNSVGKDDEEAEKAKKLEKEKNRIRARKRGASLRVDSEKEYRE